MSNIDSSVMFKISYGLYLVTVNDGGRQNGCIINTVNQLTSSPLKLCIAVDKSNYTAEMIKSTSVFNISVLTEDVPFSLIERFGFESGREKDKFSGFTGAKLAENGTAYLTEHCNAVISCRVTDTVDCSTHYAFIAEVTVAESISDAPSVTYDYYLKNIKPSAKAEKGFVCKICGYVYEGDTLPEDFICPLCKHPASDFEPIK